MQNSLKIKIQFVISFLILSALIGGIFFLFKKTELKLNEYIKSQEEFSSLEKKASYFEQKEDNYKKILPLFLQIENSFFEVKKEEIENEKIAQIIEKIEEAGKKEEIEVETKNVTQPKGNNNFYLFEFEIKGNFVNILRFLFYLENTPMEKYYLMEIRKINLSRVIEGECIGGNSENCQEKNPKVGVSGQIELKIFSKK